MIKNYFKVALRGLFKEKMCSAINLSGLAIGFSTCMLIFLFINHELGFDTFHEKADHVYRLNELQTWAGIAPQHVALSMYPMAPALIDEYPEIANYARIRSGPNVLQWGEKQILLQKALYADQGFLELFSFPFLYGEPASALDGPAKVVLTESTSRRLFGDRDPLGQNVQYEEQLFLVSGVVRDAPKRSHLQFDALYSMATIDTERRRSQWGSNNVNTYLLLKPNAVPKALEAKFPGFLEKYVGEGANESYQLYLQPLKDIHLGSAHITHDYQNWQKFDKNYILVFSFLAIFVLIIACLNYTNLTTARSTNRAKEIGVRKSVGAFRKQLIVQFIGESVVLYVLVALVLAFLLTELFLPFLNSISERQLSTETLFSPFHLGSILIMAIGVGVLAGLYPAVFLSSFHAAKVLKSSGSTVINKVRLRNILVVIQFAIAIGLIISTITLLRQFSFMRQKKLGFNKDQVVVVPMNSSANENYNTLKQELLNLSGVSGVTASLQRLGNNIHQMSVRAESADTLRGLSPSNTVVDFNYLSFYEIELASGREFRKDFASDRRGQSFVVNEAFVRDLGWEKPLNKGIKMAWVDTLGSVIGVMKDFNYNSLHHKIQPLVMSVQPNWSFNEISLRVSTQDVQNTLREVKQVWDTFVPDRPFNYEFLDEHFTQLYRSDRQISQVAAVVAALAIITACLGLFGLATIIMRQRIKEIGVRKVLGATMTSLLALLTKEFVRLVFLANLVGAPIAWLVINHWLQDFAYRISIGWLVFVVAGGLALVIALLTVSTQALRAATANPVEALRYE